MSENIDEDGRQYEWKEVTNVKKKQTRNNKSIQPLHQNSHLTDFYRTVNNEKFISEKGNISLWMLYIIDGDIEYLINERLKVLNKISDGKIDNLWNCLFNQYIKNIDVNSGYKNSNDLRDSIYLLDNKKHKYNDDDHFAMENFAKKYNLQLIFVSIDNNLKDIVYGRNLLKSFLFLHIGMDLFLELKSDKTTHNYKFTEDCKLLISNAINIEKILSENQKKLNSEIDKLDAIKKKLRGLQKADSYNFDKLQEKKLKYDIYSQEQLDKMDYLILCILKMENAHSGKAIPVSKSTDMKFREIRLNSRRNCGYNAFENDLVYVKINDMKNYTGKVIYVHHSNHKPVHNIYICKVNKDQGSLMTPLDKSFSKIHVDNEPGRRHYKAIINKRNLSKITPQQKSVVDRERESARYGDNLYYSLYDFQINKSSNKPETINPQIMKFNPDTCDYLFIVLYEYWDPHFMYPSGKIVGTLTTRDSFADNLHVIASICNIDQLDITQQYEKEIKIIQMSHDNKLTNKLMPSDALVFTIDNETTVDIDDAISYHKENGDVIIGIHISDVTKYILPTSEIYKQAKNKFCTSYPPKFSNKLPIQIFDERLSTDILSLVPHQPRSVVSVYFRFNETMQNRDFKLSEIIQPTFDEGVIVSKYKLNYDDVSSWLRQNIAPPDVDGDLFSALADIYKITTKLRRARLPESYFVKSLNDCHQDLSICNSFEGKFLIEELMLLANEYVAKKIYEKYPDSTLLRMQDPVIYHEEWTENLFQLTNMNFAGQLKDYCKLINVNINYMNPDKKLMVSRKFFEKFNDFVNNDKDKAKSLLQHDVYINEFYVHIKEWYGISTQILRKCSIKNCENMGHFSLNKPLFTDFTNPIRRFTDVVVHRLLKSILSNKEIPKDSLEIDEVCAIANTRSERNKTFEKLCAPYSIFNETNGKYCFILDCVCNKISDGEISFIHPILQKALGSKSIKFTHLSLDVIPVILLNNETIDNCRLRWRKLIYSCPPYLNSTQNLGCNKFIIDNHLYDSYLPPSAWKQFQEIRRSYQSGENLTDELESLRSKFVSNEYTNIISSDSFSVVDPIIDIELNIFIKNTMRIQFCKYTVNGLSQICPELFIITPNFHICLIHHNGPVKHFTPGGKLNLKHDDIKKEFDSIEDYQSYFEPLIEAESLVEALSENSAFTLEKVPIKWIVSVSPRTKCKQRYGVFILSTEFCKSRNNIFDDDKFSIIDRCEYLIAKGISSVGGDLMCLRYKKENWNNYWVGHGHVVHIEKCKFDNTIMTVVIFRLTQSNFDIFPKCSERDLFTLDLYPKSVVSIRQQIVIASINKYKFINEIIFGNPNLIEEIDSRIINEIENGIERCSVLKLNSRQMESIKMAFNQKLSLISGPAGTGKTTVGCYLSYGYTLYNKILLKYGNSNKMGVVLYCGPSNDSVNIIDMKMRDKFHNNCPKFLRIFEEQQELSDFPIPGYFSKNEKLSPQFQEFSLHYLIRKEGERANQLKCYDENFEKIFKENKCSTGINIHDLIVEYKKVIKEAKEEFILKNRFDMVLCTTSVTATIIMKMFNFTQVIIDDAGMCKEPETLIPIAVTEETVRNVVLIGDYIQLRPIVKSPLAKNRGLQISFFERYRKLRPGKMLNLQYRMHPSICEFPSNEFYKMKLKTQISTLWTGLKPEHMKVTGRFDYETKLLKQNGIFHKYWNGIDYNKAIHTYNEFLKQSNYNAIPNEKWPGRRNIPYQCFNGKFRYYYERVVFVHVIGDEITQSVVTRSGNENFKGNKEEVEVAGYIYGKIINNCGDPYSAPNHVTVLTQYELQKDLLEEKCSSILEKLKINTKPIVKTVIRSLGSESDYVIFSTVRSIKDQKEVDYNSTPGWEKQYLGFVTDRNEVNVALTRAKKGLIIIGNKNLLEVNYLWKKLLSDLEQRGCIITNYKNFI